MAQRIAGIAFVYVDGVPLELRGSFTVSPTKRERGYIAGQDGVHGFSEMPRVPFIEGDISLPPQTSVADIDAMENVTVVAQLANGWNYTLREASTVQAREINTREGMTRVRWEGVDMDEFRSG